MMEASASLDVTLGGNMRTMIAMFVSANCARENWFIMRYDFGRYTRVDVGYGECVP